MNATVAARRPVPLAARAALWLRLVERRPRRISTMPDSGSSSRRSSLSFIGVADPLRGARIRVRLRPRCSSDPVLCVIRWYARSSSSVDAECKLVSEWKLSSSPPSSGGAVAVWRERGRPELERRRDTRSAARATSRAAAYNASTESEGPAYTGLSVMVWV